MCPQDYVFLSLILLKYKTFTFFNIFNKNDLDLLVKMC